MLCAVEYDKSTPDQLTTTSAKLQIEEGALTAAFDELQEYSGSLQMPEATVQAQVKSNLHNYIP